ncbi:periplasmic solute-binding protein [Geotalea daltonii FRC-32]|uniref:Periplasmic solute-binding protein n=1 Tax=Geotalea daltonii (strain DSM 22248 / JCM 15807 / FRC-32) TaxID=316067 RepID=B9M7W8_GEODF|nr:substrate-binding domain-containing protein [Geotalea daltonii]ACM18426.1 periplasmic solute-binding protein [Geotalea daltonii FRC-32]
MKRDLIFKRAMVCLIVAGFLTATAASAETVIKVGGSGGPLGSAKLLAKAYMKIHKGVSIKVLPSLGSSGGIKAVIGGAVDIALSGRPLKAEEKSRGAVETKYARSPYVFITHRQVNKESTTIREVEQLYGGKIREWPDGKQVRLVMRPESDSDTKLLRSLSPGMDQAVLSAIRQPEMNFAVTDQDSIDMVMKIPGSFGGATLTQVLTEKLPVKVLALDGVQPKAKTMKEAYPVWKEFYIVTLGNSSEAAKEFAAFFSSPAGRKILAANGNQPL